VTRPIYDAPGLTLQHVVVGLLHSELADSCSWVQVGTFFQIVLVGKTQVTDHMGQSVTRQVDAFGHIHDLDTRKTAQLFTNLDSDIAVHCHHLKSPVHSGLVVHVSEINRINRQDRGHTLNEDFLLVRLDQGAVDEHRGGESAGHQRRAVAIEDVTSRRMDGLLEPGLFFGRLGDSRSLCDLEKPEPQTDDGEKRHEHHGQNRKANRKSHANP
jgi:hypothetical protein